jgi:hypothetical protein
VGVFEEEIDDVQPISISRGLTDTEPCNWIDSLSNKEIQEEQMHDPDLKPMKPILLWIQGNYEPGMMDLKLSSKATRYYWMCRSQLQLEKGVLFYRWEDPISPKLLLVIPDSMRKQILELCHCLPLSGHMGQIKTVIKLKQHVLWYGMGMVCKLFVKSCKICNKNKKSTKHHRARLGQYDAGVPIERIHMDILGPLPVTRQKNKYILKVIDQFTQWLACSPIPNQAAETVATVLIDGFIARLGCPLELHTDQGRNVDGHLVR